MSDVGTNGDSLHCHVVTCDCHIDDWLDCPRVAEFQRHIEGMAFRGCNCRSLWEHEPPDRWIEAIERDAANVRTLCRVGVAMGIFTCDGTTAKAVEGCRLGREVMRHACTVDQDVLSASIAVRVKMLGVAASEANRLAIRHTMRSHNAGMNLSGDEPEYAPRNCSVISLRCTEQRVVRPRFVVVSDGLEASVHDLEIRRDLFPTLSGNRKDACDGCGLGTAQMIAVALNFYEANAQGDFLPPGKENHGH